MLVVFAICERKQGEMSALNLAPTPVSTQHSFDGEVEIHYEYLFLT